MLARTILADVVPSVRWWSRARGLPPEAYETWVASMREVPRRQTRVLAWASSPHGPCIGSPAVLSYPSGTGWTHVGWHEIEHGGWNAETRSLSWRLLGGRRGAVELTAPGRLPELFRERVAATIVLERFVAVDDEAETSRGITISGRRDLADGATDITWHATLTRGTTWSTPGARATADDAIARLRSEYDSGS